MKILHVTQNYFPSVGGPQYTMKHLSEKLVEYYGDAVEVCTTNSLYGPETKLFKKIEPSEEMLSGVHVERLPFNRWHYPLLELGNKTVAKLTGKPLPHSIIKKRWGLDSPAIDRKMIDSRADVIMATTIIYNFADYPLWRFKTSKPKPFVLYGAIHLHKPLPENSPLISRAKACDCYIANTDFERTTLINYGVDESKIVTIGTGIELKDFEIDKAKVAAFKAQHSIEESDVVIGFIGRLVKGKGVAILIDAFRKLYKEYKNIKLVLAGGITDYVPEVEKIIAEEKLPIILIQNFENHQKKVLFHALDVFVLASQSESFGVVFLEAWACKKPVVGADMGAIKSLLTNNKDSLLFQPGDVDSLVSCIQSLIDDRNMRDQFGENGFRKIVEHYTWPTIVSKYREAYKTGIDNFKSQFFA